MELFFKILSYILVISLVIGVISLCVMSFPYKVIVVSIVQFISVVSQINFIRKCEEKHLGMILELFLSWFLAPIVTAMIIYGVYVKMVFKYFGIDPTLGFTNILS